MNRRQFVALSTGSLLATPFLQVNASPSVAKPAWLIEWIKIHDKQLPNYKSLKINTPTRRYYGGYMNDAELPNVQTTSGFLIKSCMLMACPESVYYQSEALLKEVEEAAQALLQFQHADGTIDLLETNFHSTPDVAFVLENIVPAYKYLKNNAIKGKEKALGLLEKFLKSGGEALVVGGIHTPNHRWVVSAALTKLYELFGDKRYTARIDQWLAENIDIDPDGQYNEKSTNTYSPIVNRSLIVMARGLNKPELLDPVRKNLAMTMYFVHPNGEVVTEASNRQDKGIISNMARYYYAYRYMALNDKSGEMAAMCRLIEQTSTKEQLAGFLDYFLEDSKLWKDLPPNKPTPTDYAKAFTYAGVVRIRRGNWDTTLLANNAGWLTFHKGNAVLQAMRVATSFFGKGQFQSEKIVQEGNVWLLKNTLEGPYYQPHTPDKIAPDGDWEKMPRATRAQSEVQKLETIVKVSEVQNGIQIDFEITGTDHVPVAVELVFREGGTLGGVEKYAKRENAYLLAGDSGTYTIGNDIIEFGKGQIAHKYVQLRGALPPIDAPTVYITGFTPFRHTIMLK